MPCLDHSKLNRYNYVNGFNTLPSAGTCARARSCARATTHIATLSPCGCTTDAVDVVVHVRIDIHTSGSGNIKIHIG